MVTDRGQDVWYVGRGPISFASRPNDACLLTPDFQEPLSTLLVYLDVLLLHCKYTIGATMKPITINELAPLLGTPRFTGGVFATKGARIGVFLASIVTILGLGFGADAWGLGASAGAAMAFVCLLFIPYMVRKRYANELIAEDLPNRIAYLYRKYKGGNRMAKWIDQWYEEYNQGTAMTAAKMLVILQHTWSSAYSGLSAKRSHLKGKNLAKTHVFNKSMSNGRSTA